MATRFECDWCGQTGERAAGEWQRHASRRHDAVAVEHEKLELCADCLDVTARALRSLRTRPAAGNVPDRWLDPDSPPDLDPPLRAGGLIDLRAAPVRGEPPEPPAEREEPLHNGQYGDNPKSKIQNPKSDLEDEMPGTTEELQAQADGEGDAFEDARQSLLFDLEVFENVEKIKKEPDGEQLERLRLCRERAERAKSAGQLEIARAAAARYGLLGGGADVGFRVPLPAAGNVESERAHLERQAEFERQHPLTPGGNTDKFTNGRLAVSGWGEPGGQLKERLREAHAS